MITIIFASGGSGGHLAPAIALAQRVVHYGVQPIIATTTKAVDMRMQSCYPKIRFLQYSGYGFSGSLQSLLAFLVGVLKALPHSIASVNREQPLMVFVTGGFGCVPIVVASLLLGIPVHAHESNSVPGKLTRFFSSVFTRLFVTRLMDQKSWNLNRTEVVGFPIRIDTGSISKLNAQRVFGLPTNKKILTFFGGSQGARALTQFAEKVATTHEEESIHVMCVTGPANYKPQEKRDNLTCVSFVEDMRALYLASDLLVSRAGAGSLAEISNYGCPAILVPLPTSADDHQQRNAEVFSEQGCSILWNQDDLDDNLGRILKILFDEQILSGMKHSQRKWMQNNDFSKMIAYMTFELDRLWL